jgi:hypothetical protein
MRAPTDDWQKLIAWRIDLHKRGFRLLRVTSAHNEMVAIFGRSRDRSRELTDADLKAP